MDKGERFYIAAIATVGVSYLTPHDWFLDAIGIGLLLIIATVMNARERRVW